MKKLIAMLLCLICLCFAGCTQKMDTTNPPTNVMVVM